MKSGTVNESMAAVKLRSRGATTIHAKRQKPTDVGMNNSHGKPQSYVRPLKPTNEFVLAYVAKNERPITQPPMLRPPT